MRYTFDDMPSIWRFFAGGALLGITVLIFLLRRAQPKLSQRAIIFGIALLFDVIVILGFGSGNFVMPEEGFGYKDLLVQAFLLGLSAGIILPPAIWLAWGIGSVVTRRLRK